MTTPTQGNAGVLDGEAATYASAVRDALADLPPTEREEVCEDLDGYLADVMEELGEDAPAGALLARLGPPEAYAAELRAAAGYPSATDTDALARPRPPGLLALARLRARAAGSAVVGWVEGLPGGVALVTLLRELRPAWWVARAWIIVLALDWVFGGGPRAPFPSAFGAGQLGGFLLVVLAIAGSVWLGRRASRSRPVRLWSLPVNVLAVLALLPMTSELSNAVEERNRGGYAEVVYMPSGELTHEDGAPIRNIYPFDSAGTPLSGVYLFDQDGRRIDNLASPDCFFAREPRDTSTGFPLERLTMDTRTGECVRTGQTAPDFSVVIPKPSASPSAPSGSADSSPSPAPGSAPPTATPTPSTPAPTPTQPAPGS